MIARRPLLALALAVPLGLSIGERRSAADDRKDACVAAYTSAQRLRKAGKLLAARTELVACSQRDCPASLVTDCSPWLVEVDVALPSIVVEARDESGHDVAPVRVLVDGVELASSLDGLAASLDPGAHTLRFEHGDRRVEQEVVIREGEQRRRIQVVFPAPSPPPLPASPPPPPAPDPLPPPLPRRPAPSPARGLPAPPLASYAIGGAGLASLAVSAGIGIAAKLELADLRGSCAPACDPDRVSAIHDRMLAADTLLVVGVAAAATAIVVWAVHPAPRRAAAVRGLGLYLEL